MLLMERTMRDLTFAEMGFVCGGAKSGGSSGGGSSSKSSPNKSTPSKSTQTAYADYGQLKAQQSLGGGMSACIYQSNYTQAYHQELSTNGYCAPTIRMP
jgi:hypothetical protein